MSTNPVPLSEGGRHPADRPDTLIRAPVDVEGGSPPTPREFATAVELVDASGVVEVVGPLVDSDIGRPRSLNFRAFCVAAQVNALRPHHVAHLVAITKVMNSFSHEQLQALGITDWGFANSYLRFERLFLRIFQIFREGNVVDVDGEPTTIDARWVANREISASRPSEYVTSGSIAIDGTDVPTWGRLHGDVETLVLDLEETDEERSDDVIDFVARTARKKRRARILGVGPDGRNIYTADPTARAGWRSATGKRKAGPFNGYELHTLVQTRDLAWSNGVTRARVGPQVPPLILGIALVPAGTHRSRTVVPMLLEGKERGWRIDDVLVDPGYSLAKPEFLMHPLHEAGIHVTFRPASHQWKAKPFSEDAIVSGGQLFDARLPEDLRDLRPPGRDATASEKTEIEEAFNRKAPYRYTLHAGPDDEGFTRWRSPFSAGLLRSRELPWTMRRPVDSGPLVSLPPGTRPAATISVSAADLPLRQRLPTGTAAHNISMGRRQIVETMNAQLKGGFVDLEKGQFRVFGTDKIEFLLGFTIAALNVRTVRMWRARLAAESLNAAKPRPRARRRRGTYGQVLALTQAGSPSDPVRGPPR